MDYNMDKFWQKQSALFVHVLFTVVLERDFSFFFLTYYYSILFGPSCQTCHKWLNHHVIVVKSLLLEGILYILTQGGCSFLFRAVYMIKSFLTCNLVIWTYWFFLPVPKKVKYAYCCCSTWFFVIFISSWMMFLLHFFFFYSLSKCSTKSNLYNILTSFTDSTLSI